MKALCMIATQKLLLIDDEPSIVMAFQTTLTSPHLKVLTAKTAAEGLATVKAQRPDAILIDVRLPDQSGLELYAQIREFDPRIPVVIITAFARTETAIEAMRLGAFEYLTKPVELGRLREVVEKALDLSRLNRVPAVLESDNNEDGAADRIVGNSHVMQEVYKAIGRIAPQENTVLILGESGTGKELVARALYHYSRRSKLPFLAINCAALPESLLESELFGHERGAFTGADQRRIGKFEQVHGGTIFLDEIGDMSPATQAKALRLLQEQQFERVGGNVTISTDVRVIAATNQQLSELVAQGKFRQDLYYRLNGFTIELPPLRERKEDLALLTSHFINRFNREIGKSIRAVTEEVTEQLHHSDWPGNVREFQSVIRYAMVQATGEILTRDCLPPTFQTSVSQQPACSPVFNLVEMVRAQLAAGKVDIYQDLMMEVDRRILSEVLSATSGNQTKTAEILGMARMTLRNRLRTLGLSAEDSST